MQMVENGELHGRSRSGKVYGRRGVGMQMDREHAGSAGCCGCQAGVARQVVEVGGRAVADCPRLSMEHSTHGCDMHHLAYVMGKYLCSASAGISIKYRAQARSKKGHL